jgi:molybdopterin-guanine dinucleotide biosynthesis protein A
MGGGDKPLLRLGTGTLLSHVIERFSPQVAALALSANGDGARFARFGLPVLPDADADRAGPLAGILAGLDWAAALGAEAVVSAAGDTPFLPPDLVPRLLLAANGGPALAATARGRHPTFGLWPISLRDDLRAALARGERRVADFADLHRAEVASFRDQPFDPFFNVNTPDDLIRARAML